MYNQSIELFKRHHYKEALEGFKQCITENQNQDRVLSSFNYVLTILKQLRMPDEWDLNFKKFIDYLSKNKLYRELNEEFRDDHFAKHGIPLSLLNYAWKAALEVGEIDRSRAFAQQLIEHYLVKKNFARGITLIEEIGRTVKIDRELSLALAQFNLMRGDGDTAALKLQRALDQKIIRRQDIARISQQFNLTELRRTSYIISPLYIKLQLEQATSVGSSSVKCKKNLINILYLGFLFDHTNPPILHGLLRYAAENGKKKIFESICQICRTQKINWKLFRDLKKQIDELIAGEHVFTDEVSLTWEEDLVDMATDLFSTDANQKKAMAESQRRMERAIEFLQEIGEDTKAMQLLHREEKTAFVIEDTFSADSNIDKIEENLRNLLNQFKAQFRSLIGEKDEGAVDLSDERIKSYIAKGGIDIAGHNYRDIVVALSEMGLNSAACEALNQFVSSGQLEGLENRIEFYYLKVEILRKLSRFGEAIALLKEMLDTWALDREELICFHYLAAETYRDNHIPERALYHYQIVEQMDPTYRLVTKRMNELV